jgi:hypothetical protein
MKRNILIFLSTLLCFANFLAAQEEYFVQINPVTCTYTIIDSIPGVKWISDGESTFDKTRRRFIFIGQDGVNNNYLYSINAINGTVVSNPQILTHFGGFRFDNSNGILYAIHWSSVTSNAEFVSANPANLSFTVIHHMNLTGMSTEVAFDDVNHRYILADNDSLGVNCLFTIDAATGSIISKPPLGNVSGIQFDNATGNLYGLHWDSGLQKETFVSINTSTGAFTTINVIPLVTSIVMGLQSLDESNQRYSFYGSDNTNNNYLFTLDVSNGQVISNPPYPVFVNPFNLIETRYDNSNGNLYGLNWGPYPVHDGIVERENGEAIHIYPNPATSTLTVHSSKELGMIQIYNSMGEMVFQTRHNNSKQEIDISNLAKGVYTLKTDDKYLKLIKE